MDPFLSSMFFFQTYKTHNMLAMMLDSITRVWDWSLNMLARISLFEL
jgi:hypothetical protein